MIELKNEKIFAEGSVRNCYIHPNEPDKLLKVMKLSLNEKRKHCGKWYKKFRPLFCFDSNLRELKAHKYLEGMSATHGRAASQHFPKCFGMIKTDLGDALCVELIHSFNDDVVIGLNKYIKAHGLNEKIKNALDDFFLFLTKNNIIISDLHIENLVVKQCNNGELAIYMIDGFGNTDFIPIANICPHFARAKIKRKIARFKKILDGFI